MKLSDLSGDSTVSEVCFANGRVQCRFKDGETDEIYDLSVLTQVLFTQSASEQGSVHVRLIDLRKKLPVEPQSQMYLAPTEFGAQIQAAREGFLLAVGLNSTEWPLFLQIRGYQMLIACPIQSEESVVIKLIGQ